MSPPPTRTFRVRHSKDLVFMVLFAHANVCARVLRLTRVEMDVCCVGGGGVHSCQQVCRRWSFSVLALFARQEGWHRWHHPTECSREALTKTNQNKHNRGSTAVSMNKRSPHCTYAEGTRTRRGGQQRCTRAHNLSNIQGHLFFSFLRIWIPRGDGVRQLVCRVAPVLR